MRRATRTHFEPEEWGGFTACGGENLNANGEPCEDWAKVTCQGCLASSSAPKAAESPWRTMDPAPKAGELVLLVIDDPGNLNPRYRRHIILEEWEDGVFLLATLWMPVPKLPNKE